MGISINLTLLYHLMCLIVIVFMVSCKVYAMDCLLLRVI